MNVCQKFRQIQLLGWKPVDFSVGRQKREWLSLVPSCYLSIQLCMDSVWSSWFIPCFFLYYNFDRQHWSEWWWCKARHQTVMWCHTYCVWCNRVNVGQKRTEKYPENPNLTGNSFFSKVDCLQILSETASSFSLQYKKRRKFWSPDIWKNLLVSPAAA